MPFGRKLKELRLKADLTQAELAAAVGVDFTYLSKIENERVEPPSERIILRMAETLLAKLGPEEVDPDELIALAGKIPSKILDSLAEDPERIRRAIVYLRSVSGNVASRGDWEHTISRHSEREDKQTDR